MTETSDAILPAISMQHKEDQERHGNAAQLSVEKGRRARPRGVERRGEAGLKP